MLVDGTAPEIMGFEDELRGRRLGDKFQNSRGLLDNIGTLTRV